MTQTSAAIDLTDPETIKVLWTAMCAMTQDVHCPQDQLSETQWALAYKVFHCLGDALGCE